MRQLKRLYLYVIICMAVFFNIERLDFGQPNPINIQSEIYILVSVAVVLTLFVPSLNRAPVSALLTFWVAIYLAIKLITSSEHPLLGGIYSYLTITELVFVLLLVYLAQRLGQIVEQYISAAQILSLAGIDTSVPDLKAVEEQIQSEINRSRHFSRSMSVVLVKADLNSTQITLPSLLAEVQASFVQRYLNAKVAHVIKKELRRMDILAADHRAGHLVIINPETSAQDTTHILERIQSCIYRELGIHIALSTASFPDHAYSFDDLLKVAEKELKSKELRPVPFIADPIPPTTVELRKIEVEKD